MDVVILIRHPAAVANSYKALNWGHPFSHFLDQPALVEGSLAPFRREIEEFAVSQKDIVDQAALLWKLIHYMIDQYRQSHPDWIFVRYIDLALEPLQGYQDLFKRLGLTFSGPARRYLQANSLQEGQTEKIDPYAIRKNARLAAMKWKQTLNPREINRIRSRVEAVSSAFYSDAEWLV
jgi:hypothetical protein